MGLFTRKPKTPAAPPEPVTRDSILTKCGITDGQPWGELQSVARDEEHQAQLRAVQPGGVDGVWLFTLRPEQGNRYDKHAIAVTCNGQRVGYTSMPPSTQAKASAKLRNHLGALNVVGEVNEWNGQYVARYYLPKGVWR